MIKRLLSITNLSGVTKRPTICTQRGLLDISIRCDDKGIRPSNSKTTFWGRRQLLAAIRAFRTATSGTPYSGVFR
jgi:hypothetical protein